MTASWQDLERPKRKDIPPSELALACAEILVTPGGKRLMAALRDKYLFAVPEGLPDDRALLAHHAMRQLVRELDRATQQGLAAIAKGKKAHAGPESQSRS